MLVDTVGFIRKLPHTLVDAFRSTLEEVVQADLLLMVSDASEEALDQQRQVVCSVLSDLGAGEKPCIDVLNKTDCAREDAMLPGAVRVSARTGRRHGRAFAGDCQAPVCLATDGPPSDSVHERFAAVLAAR